MTELSITFKTASISTENEQEKPDLKREFSRACRQMRWGHAEAAIQLTQNMLKDETLNIFKTDILTLDSNLAENIERISDANFMAFAMERPEDFSKLNGLIRSAAQFAEEQANFLSQDTEFQHLVTQTLKDFRFTYDDPAHWKSLQEATEISQAAAFCSGGYQEKMAEISSRIVALLEDSGLSSEISKAWKDYEVYIAEQEEAAKNESPVYFDDEGNPRIDLPLEYGGVTP